MSLFDNIMDTPAGDANNETQDPGTNQEVSGENKSEPAWWYDKNTPGTGDRPDWLPSQFKSAEDAARSYAELQKKVGTAPDSYDFSKGSEWIEPEYEPFQELAAFAKSKHVPQDVMDKMLESVGKYINEFKVDYNEERAKLGDNAKERLELLNNWAKSNFTEDTFSALTSSMTTAEQVKAIEEIRNKMVENNTMIPNDNIDAGGSVQTIEDIQLEIAENLEKYKTDHRYRKEITAKIERASKDSGFVDKIY